MKIGEQFPFSPRRLTEMRIRLRGTPPLLALMLGLIPVMAWGTQASPPSLNPTGCLPTDNCNTTKTVTVTNTNSPACTTLRYTLNGAEPTSTTTTTVTSGSTVAVNHSLTLKVKCFIAEGGYTDSDTVSGQYIITSTTAVSAPTVSPAADTYATAQSVALFTSSPDTDATIRYTLDGTTPTLFSTLYTGPITVDATATIKSKAFKLDMTPSSTTTATYTISADNVVKTPTFQPAPGTYTSKRDVTIASATSGSTIYYTTDGRDPTTSSSSFGAGVASGAVEVSQSMTLKAMAIHASMTTSGVHKGDYAVTGAIAAGMQHALALTTDGNVWAWGFNQYSELGIGTNGTGTDSHIPVHVKTNSTTNLTDIVAIAAGTDHSLALKNDGTVWAWGYNGGGQLGINSYVEQSYAVQVIKNTTGPVYLTGVVAIAAGDNHSAALLSDGTVWTWGYNTDGELGDGSTTTRTLPVQVTALSGITHIAASISRHMLAIKSDGAASGPVWGWGENLDYRLGDGTSTDRLDPVSVTNMSDAVGISAVNRNSFAIRANGSAWSWGSSHAKGMLGDGTVTDRSAPVRVLNFYSDQAPLGGDDHSIGVNAKGNVYTWGGNNNGVRGEGSSATIINSRLTPASLTLPNSVIAVAAGSYSSYALQRDGTIWSWGGNSKGQLGINSTSDATVPTKLYSDFVVGDNSWLTGDPDNDGLQTWKEMQLGSDPRNPDTNGDGVTDGAAYSAGISLINPDMDGDGLTNAYEISTKHTNPFLMDTDGDDTEYNNCDDGADSFPLDPEYCGLTHDPDDHTAPTITLTEPANAVPE